MDDLSDIQKHIHTHVHDDGHHMCKIARMDNCEKVIEEYDKWASEYDEHLEKSTHNKYQVIDEIKKLVGEARDVRILDVACATGVGGEMLRKEGFTSVDGLDPSKEMLNVAKSKDVFKNYICAFVGNGHELPIEDETYDVVLIIGGLAHNHMQPDCFKNLSRILKSGGIMVSISSLNQLGKEKSNYEAAMRKNHDDGILNWLSTTPVRDYLQGMDGVIYSFLKP